MRVLVHRKGKPGRDTRPIAYAIKMICSQFRLMQVIATSNGTNTEIETLRWQRKEAEGREGSESRCFFSGNKREQPAVVRGEKQIENRWQWPEEKTSRCLWPTEREKEVWISKRNTDRKNKCPWFTEGQGQVALTHREWETESMVMASERESRCSWPRDSRWPWPRESRWPWPRDSQWPWPAERETVDGHDQERETVDGHDQERETAMAMTRREREQSMAMTRRERDSRWPWPRERDSRWPWPGERESRWPWPGARERDSRWPWPGERETGRPWQKRERERQSMAIMARRERQSMDMTRRERDSRRGERESRCP